MNLLRDGALNLAGLLLFGRRPHFRLPLCIVKAAAFPGTDIAVEHYIDSRDIHGKLANVFEQALGFVLANIRHVQDGQSVNSLGKPEVPRIVFEELIANALIHRDYFVSAPVRLLVFADRIEIISPGHLPIRIRIYGSSS